MKSPILFIAFNRPLTTKRVFEAIREAKPPKLFLALDGPRGNRPDDVANNNKIKQIISNVDWECEVHTLFRDKNLGCKNAVSSAITWFFENVEQGIILEDDCLPAQSFFQFCDELLDKYKFDEKIMMISGNNFQHGQKVSEADYYFSQIFCIWGWASWRRAWEKYDGDLKTYPEFKKTKKIKNNFNNEIICWYWIKALDRVANESINTWDYQWFYSIWSNNGLCTVPNINLVQNIGFDGDGTHTAFNSKIYSVPTHEFRGDIIHPNSIQIYNEVDERAFKNFYKVDISKSKIILKKIFDKKFKKTVG